MLLMNKFKNFISSALFQRKVRLSAHLDRCKICNSDKIKLFMSESPASLYKCSTCGLIFYSPLPSKETLNLYYSSEQGYLPSINDTMKVYKNDYKNRAARYENFIQKMLSYLPQPEKLLEIGCGYGFFLLYCKEKGFEPHGIEISEQTSEWAREQNLDVFTCTTQKAPFKDDSFSFITSFHCLEHVLDPKAEISKIFSLCKKGGIFLLAVPNASSLVAENSFSTWKWKSWPNHLFYFSPDNLKYLLTSAGFEILEMFSQVGDSDINDDRNVLDNKIQLTSESRDDVLNILYTMNKGQELVILARKA